MPSKYILKDVKNKNTKCYKLNNLFNTFYNDPIGKPYILNAVKWNI
jgi:hypothetical protein